MIKERDFRRRELLEKYTTKILYRQKNRKSEKKISKKVKMKLVEVKVCFFEREILKKE